MTLKDQMAADSLAVLLNTDEMADSVSYSAVSLSFAARTISAVVNIEHVTDSKRQDGQLWPRAACIGISRDTTDGIPDPARDDRVTINGEVWTVTGIKFMDDSWAELEISRPEQIEKSRRDLRLGI